MSVKARKNQEGKTVFAVRVQYCGLRVCRTIPSTMTEAKRVESRLPHELINDKYEILKSKIKSKI
jgi:hypothetical protein